MKILFIISMIIFFISFIVMFIAMILSKKTFMDREKISPFECGFDPKSSARLPFSIHFFLIAVIFLIFDVEITLLIPLILIFKIINMSSFLLISIFFLMILLLGIYHEWSQGALNWTF
uniref:NADH-ubiquinone oxidoreductase chain 3 n=1 Tax=Ochthebius sp. IBE<ESP> AN104 TaxID=2769895 RepID=A0A7H0DJW9_9COLE|nr:NADH dehydrogenase subunit 3 [Ochthebius sp. IBE<ESP> AN104]